MLVLSSDLIDAMKYLFGYNGYLANVAMMAMIEISAMLAIISRNTGANKPGSKSSPHHCMYQDVTKMDVS